MWNRKQFGSQQPPRNTDAMYESMVGSGRDPNKMNRRMRKQQKKRNKFDPDGRMRERYDNRPQMQAFMDDRARSEKVRVDMGIDHSYDNPWNGMQPKQRPQLGYKAMKDQLSRPNLQTQDKSRGMDPRGVRGPNMEFRQPNTGNGKNDFLEHEASLQPGYQQKMYDKLMEFSQPGVMPERMQPDQRKENDLKLMKQPMPGQGLGQGEYGFAGGSQNFNESTGTYQNQPLSGEEIGPDGNFVQPQLAQPGVMPMQDPMTGGHIGPGQQPIPNWAQNPNSEIMDQVRNWKSGRGQQAPGAGGPMQGMVEQQIPERQQMPDRAGLEGMFNMGEMKQRRQRKAGRMMDRFAGSSGNPRRQGRMLDKMFKKSQKWG